MAHGINTSSAPLQAIVITRTIWKYSLCYTFIELLCKTSDSPSMHSISTRMQLLKHTPSSLQSKMQSSKAIPHRSTQKSFNSGTLKDQRWVYWTGQTFFEHLRTVIKRIWIKEFNQRVMNRQTTSAADGYQKQN